ncbi:MAG: ferritin family protein [Sulfurospirillaceae bacterium]|nr:ferritin family protein [Sulfurospirillaceae bacterium]
MKQYQTYVCKKCGNEVEVQKVGGGKLVCCGEAMHCVTENLTVVNLMKAFAGESQARNKYEFFAEIARKEGFRDIAEHFQRAANNEKQHAKMEFALAHKMMDGKEWGDTAQNLGYARDGENYEHVTMYPDFAIIAKEEGFNEAAALFRGIGKVEVEHENMYKELLRRLESGEEFVSEDGEEEWICEVCGHIHRGKKPPKVCPLCKVEEEYFSRLNTKK